VESGVRALTDEYLRQRGAHDLSAFQFEFDSIRPRLERFVRLAPGTRLLEVGVGTGWLLVMCAHLGVEVAGVELHPAFAEHAREFGRAHDVDLDITVGDIADVELPADDYDVVVASSVFEHVRSYGAGFANVHRALRPGGLFYMYTTNKFAPRSGEYEFPLYGWMPFRLRKMLRVARQGHSVVESSGIDFNQFTYWGLKRHLDSLGFERVMDQFDFVESDMLAVPTPGKKLLLTASKRLPPVRAAGRLFAPGNCFAAIK
jgi:SAM-dependent methyltransferase